MFDNRKYAKEIFTSYFRCCVEVEGQLMTNLLPCRDCEGTGMQTNMAGEPDDCRTCEGTGRIESIEMTDLLPCLRCGGEPEVNEEDGYILCLDCGYWTGDDMSLKEAIVWWNERPAVDKLQARIAELEAQLDMAIKHIDWRELQLAEAQDKCTRSEQRISALEAQTVDMENNYLEAIGNLASEGIVMLERISALEAQLKQYEGEL